MTGTTLVTLLAIVETAYLVVLAGWIVLEKRSPGATLAWILALIALPVVGFAIYFVFGPRKLRRRRLKRLRAEQATIKPTARAYELAPAGTSPIARELVRVGQRTANARLAVATSVDVFTTGASTYDAIVEAIANAKDHVHVLYYIFEPDQTGTRIRDALVERAKAGVRVRLLVDAAGSLRARRRRHFFKPLREAGAEVATFNPVGVTALLGRLLNFRNHRKIVVCDGRVGFTGGINVTDEQNDAVRPDAWRDTHVKLTGPCVAWLQVVFLEDWSYATGTTPNASEGCFPSPDAVDADPQALVQILDSGPDRDHEAIKTAWFTAINAAQKRVLLTTAYFVPDEPLLLALQAAAMRGVDVRVLVPRKSDLRTVAAAGRSYYDELLHTGVHIYEYRPRMLHAKTLVIDGTIAFIGTANFDNRSFRLNFEVTAAIFDPKTTETLAAAFEEDLKHAKPVTSATRAKVHVRQRLVEGTARLLSPLL